MGILDALFGHHDEQTAEQTQAQPAARAPRRTPSTPRPINADEQALARYRYMLQTAPPEEIEAAHAEAFARLSPQQRQLVLQQMSQTLPESEARGLSDDPRQLARAATRAEMRQPGAIERTFGGANHIGGGVFGSGLGGAGMGGMGGMLAGSLLSSIAGSFIGSSIANSFFSHGANEQLFHASPEAQSVDGGVSDYNGGDFGDFQPTGLDSSADPYGDPGVGSDFGDASLDNTGFADGGFQETGLDSSADPYGDPGLDAGGFADTSFDGGDFGGGDFGGGDFGGGDF